jgi:magnesium transporter
MIIDCAHYRDGQRQHDGPMELEAAAALCRDADEGFVWLGLHDPDEAELELVRERFGLHELAVEDAQKFHVRPKVELYDEDGMTFVVLRTARYDDDREEIDFGEVSLFLAPRFVISVRQGAASDLHPARLRLERKPELLREGAASVLWAVLDTIVDDYAPVVEGLEADIEEVESTVFTGAAAPTERIYFLRREATEFHRAVHPLLSPLEGVERGANPQIGPELRNWFRDVNDHVKLIDEMVVAQRDLLGLVLQANMAVISVEQNRIAVQQNESMKQLTVVASVFLPLGFLAGFFGMNFGWLTDHTRAGWEFALYGVGSMAVCATLLYLVFRRRYL